MTESRIIHGDCLAELPQLAGNSVDAVITDPPYHLTSIVKRFGKPDSKPAKHGKDGAFQRVSRGFLGHDWDGGDLAFRPEVWIECLRVLKPGGYLCAFAAPRNYDLICYAIRQAGFEIRNQLNWVFGKGLPKSHNIGRAVDAKRKGLATSPQGMRQAAMGEGYKPTDRAGDPDYARTGKYFGQQGRPDDNAEHDFDNEWAGWGTDLKPCHEPIVLARKPLSEKSIADNVLRWGTGALNIDACRVPVPAGDSVPEFDCRDERFGVIGWGRGSKRTGGKSRRGRWPGNWLHDGSEAVLRQYPDSKSSESAGEVDSGAESTAIFSPGKWKPENTYDDDGSAARFFYTCKASKYEREAGLELPPEGVNKDCQRRNTHSTVKPVSLMRWLCLLVTPPGGLVLDPFAGSGTTGMAAAIEGYQYLLVEQDDRYAEIARQRVRHAHRCPADYDPETPAGKRTKLLPLENPVSLFAENDKP